MGSDWQKQRNLAIDAAMAIRKLFYIEGDVLEKVATSGYLGRILSQDDDDKGGTQPDQESTGNMGQGQPNTTAPVTIENFWARSGRELGENFLRTFTNFDRGTVDLGIWACK